jgi:hypothetical protein
MDLEAGKMVLVSPHGLLRASEVVLLLQQQIAAAISSSSSICSLFDDHTIVTVNGIR